MDLIWITTLELWICVYISGFMGIHTWPECLSLVISADLDIHH